MNARLIDAEKLKYEAEYMRPELEYSRNDVQRCIEIFAQAVDNQPTIEQETLPIVKEMQKKLKKDEKIYEELQLELLNMRNDRDMALNLILSIYLDACVEDSVDNLDWLKEKIKQFFEDFSGKEGKNNDSD